MTFIRIEHIPQISYASTSADLSDKTRFEYFSRVVPPDNYQAQAMADTARALGWTYVNTLADSGTYGEKGIQAFVEATKNSGSNLSWVRRCVFGKGTFHEIPSWLSPFGVGRYRRSRLLISLTVLIEALNPYHCTICVFFFHSITSPLFCRYASLYRNKANKHTSAHNNITLFLPLSSSQIPQISYASTSADLSDKTRFEYFSRVVPPDNYQAQAMADTARALGWTYVNTLADSGTYGEKGIQAFVEATKNSGLCISRTESIPRGADDAKVLSMVENLFKGGENNANAIIMFANEDNSRRVVKAIKTLNMTDQIHLLASDSWGAKVHPVQKQEAEAVGTVTILPKRSVIPGFDDYFLNLTLNNSRNPWFKEFWADIFNCSVGDFRKGAKKCTGAEDLRNWSAYKQEGLVQFVIDSVFALAHAAHDMLMAHCPDTLVRCPALKQLSGPEFLQFIRNVTFQELQNTAGTLEMGKASCLGDSELRAPKISYETKLRTQYEYYIPQVTHFVVSFVFRLYLNMSALRWKNGSRRIPTSICSEPCQFGQSKITGRESCCWMCVSCKENEYLPNETKCVACPTDSRPNATLTGCERLPIVTLVPASVWFVLPVAFSLAGVLCTIFVFGVFLVFNRTPIIMASGRELCYILLFGIALSYCTSVAMLARPSPLTCAVRRLGLGVSLCFVYAAILTKTNRIYSPNGPMIVGAFTWLGFEKPNVTLILVQKNTLVLKCRASQVATIVSLFYNIFLIIMCTVYAFKTRKIPQNFNEAKYIAFTMYSTCIVWLAFVPIYFGANHDFKVCCVLCLTINNLFIEALAIHVQVLF
ncbi:metabotropic glutamate receptor 8 [Aplysia californica]|uniref:Metabotropic glutamate receptor 8 n=1 Tax=Aplysia californica TaxID=6500 RepID=A0ABM1VZD9_APLCA|nr:metabotropic glutamate receptor 8 [Aplysia californica]